MFVFNRSALAVVLPIALLLAGVYCTNLATTPRRAASAESATAQPHAQTVAANLPSK